MQAHNKQEIMIGYVMVLTMTKKQITEYLILFVLGLIITIGFVNPVSKEYTWWNLIYQSKDLIQ